MPDLQAVLSKLAADFAEATVAAIQHASLEDLAGMVRSRASAVAATHAPRVATVVTSSRPSRRGGARHRRSADDIGKVTEEIVALLGKHEDGLRAEQIRGELGIARKELPRPLAEGLASGRFNKQGQKRATTYFVGGAVAKMAEPKAKRGVKAQKHTKAKRLTRTTARPR